MSILDCYFCFDRKPGAKSKTRLDLSSFTNEYAPFYLPNKLGRCWLYLFENQNYIKAHPGRKPYVSLTSRKGNHITALYTPDVDQNYLGFGDVKGTQDAVFIQMREEAGKIQQVEVWIAKGKKNLQQGLFQLFLDGELDQESESLRTSAKAHQRHL